MPEISNKFQEILESIKERHLKTTEKQKSISKNSLELEKYLEHLGSSVKEGNLSSVFGIVKNLTKQAESAENVKNFKIPEINRNTANKKLCLKGWKEFTNDICSVGKLSHNEKQKYERICLYAKIFAKKYEHSYQPFTLDDYNKSFGKMKNTSAGPDHLTKAMFPNKFSNRQKILHALNNQIFKEGDLDKKFTTAKSTMIPKGTNKTRPLSAVSKLSILAENMISTRLETAVKANYQNRYGFLSRIGVDNLYEDLINDIKEKKKNPTNQLYWV